MRFGLVVDHTVDVVGVPREDAPYALQQAAVEGMTLKHWQGKQTALCKMDVSGTGEIILEDGSEVKLPG